jgi:hypothetical protein
MSDTKNASLTVLGGPLAGTNCPLPEEGTVTIGSAPGSTLYLDLPAVSPYHARVVIEGGRITVHDTGSARTVHVNDNPLDPAGTELRNGDILWLGVPGDEEVVMMQCILPKRTAAPAPPAGEEEALPPTTPTPEIETVALWANDPSAQQAREALEHREATFAPSGAFIGEDASEAPPEPAADEPAAEPAEGPDPYAMVGESEPSSASAADDDAYTNDASESPSEVAPTLLMGGAGEVDEPVEAVPVVPAEELSQEAYQAFPAAEPIPVEEEPTAEPIVEPAPPAAPPAPVAAKPPEPPREPRPRPSRPASVRPSPPGASQRTRAVRPAPSAAARSGGGPPMLLIGGVVGALVLAAGGYFAWRAFSQRTPAPAPTPVARASVAPPVVTPTTTLPPAPVETPTPAPVTTPAVVATPTPAAKPTPSAAPTPTPKSTPTPKPTPTPRATPTPASATPPPGPSPDQQRAQQVAAFVSQAETAIGAHQYDSAITQLDSALKLDPGNARATSLRADAARRRDLARRRFVPGRTVVDSEKTRKDKASGLVGFDADDKAPDFSGRIEFEMSPSGPMEAGTAWTLKVFVVNQGRKPIKVQGLMIAASINGEGAAAPVEASVKEIQPQQRVQVGETTGSWREGTTAWAATATLTAPKSETLTNTLTWK